MLKFPCNSDVEKSATFSSFFSVKLLNDCFIEIKQTTMDANQVTINRLVATQPRLRTEVREGGQPKAAADTNSVIASPPLDSVTISSEGQRSLGFGSAVPGGISQQFQREFRVEGDRVILRLTDPITGRLIRQIPSEAEIRLRQAVKDVAQLFTG